MAKVIASKVIRLEDGYECELSCPSIGINEVVQLSAEWRPSFPDEMTNSILQKYSDGRQKFVNELSEILHKACSAIDDHAVHFCAQRGQINELVPNRRR